MKNALKVEKQDNVGVAAEAVFKGDCLQTADETVTAQEDIPLGHKIALQDIAEGDLVIKYGVPIGRASTAIPAGSHAHSHNIADITEELCRRYVEECRKGSVN